MNRSYSAVLLLIFCCLYMGFSGCFSETSYTTYYFDYFDTFSTLTVYASSEEEAAKYDEITRQALEFYHQLYNAYVPYDGIVNLYTLNASAGQGAVTVSPELYDFLSYCLDTYEVSRHTVNIALGPVLSLWQEALYSDDPTLPEETALQEASRFCDPSGLILDKNQCSAELLYPEMRLDAGALAKGYAAGQIELLLRQAGCRRALFSAGGNVVCIGSAPGLNGWNVGIQNPDTTSDISLYTTWLVQDSSVVTSGDYERYFDLDGVRYHHIIDPATLQPGRRYHSVTVSCKDSAAADMLSTALFLLPEEEGRSLAAEYGARVLYIYNDYTSG